MYDIIIIGGGIAGLYATYKIHKRNPLIKVLLIEKEKRLGGRIHTFTNENMTVEAGAGRINGSQPLIMNLIGELGLTEKLKKHNGSVVFRPADYKGTIESSVSDSPIQKTESFSSGFELQRVKPSPLYNNFVDIVLGPKTLPNAGLILNLVIASKGYSKQYLQNHTLNQFAEKVLNKEQVNYIKRSFGYYSELVIMNAYDAIKLLNSLSPSNTYYGLEGGLEQIVNKIVNIIKKNPNITVWKNREVNKIIYNNPGFSIIVNNNKYECQHCICALPKKALLKLSIFKLIRPLLNKIECGTLCRIYSQFDPTNVWFKDMDKFTTDNDLRMVIPYNTKEGTIMISYSDNIFADKWQHLYEKKGIRAINTKLREDILESTGKWIPVPKNTKIFYWDCGVGYWGVGADSAKVAEKMIQPFQNVSLYVCGENYSENGQQWIEGALETADKVLQKIL
jgi:monoamine oxidase